MRFIQKLRVLDIFGTEVGLNFQREHTYKTLFGSAISFIFIVFLSTFFWNTAISFTRKENVISTVSKIYNEDPELSQFDSNKFMFAVKINQENFITRPYFNISLETKQFITFANGTKKRNGMHIPLEICTVDHWKNLPSYGKNWTEMFHQFDLQNFLCPRKNETFLLSGRYNSEYFDHWKFSVKKCSNEYPADSLWQPTCATDEEINEFFKINHNARFLMYFNTYILDPVKSQQYVKTYIEDSLFFSVQREGAYQTGDIYLTENKVFTDQSILPNQNIQQEDFITFQTNNFRSQYVVGPVGEVLAEFFVLKDPYSYQIQRRFQKLTEILSYIGGFAQIFILICALLVKTYNDFECGVTFANQIYDFEKQENEKQQMKRISDRQKYLALNIQRNLESIQTTNKQQKDQIVNDKKNSCLVLTKKSEEIFIQKQDTCNNSSIQIRNEQSSFKNIMNKLTETPRNIKEINQSIQKSKNIESDVNDKKPKSHDFNYEQQNIQQCKQLQNEVNNDNQTKLIIDCLINNNAEEYDLCQIEKKHNQISGEYNNLNTEEFNNIEMGQCKKNSTLQYNKSNLEEMDKMNVDKCNKTIPNKYSKKDIKEENQNRHEQIQVDINKNNNQKLDQYKKLQQEYNTVINDRLNSECQDQDEISVSKEQQHDIKNNTISENDSQKQNDEVNNYQLPCLSSKHQIEQFNSNNKFKVQQKNNMDESVEPETPKQVKKSPLKQTEQKIDNKFNKLISLKQRRSINLTSKDNIIDDTLITPKSFCNTPRNIINFESSKSSYTSQQQYLTKEFEYLLKRDTTIKMTFRYFLYKLTCKKFFCSEQVKLIDKAINQMKKDLDIFVMVNKLKEIEKIKDLLLDKNQDILFNFFPKPILSARDEEENLTRTQIVNEYRDKNYKKNLKNSQVQICTKSLKNLKVDIKTAQAVSLAVKKFKNPLAAQTISFTSVKAYEKLYNAFQNINKREYSLFNYRLIEQLGDEINQIFNISNNLTNKQASQNFDSNRQIETVGSFFEQNKPEKLQLHTVRSSKFKSQTPKPDQLNNKSQYYIDPEKMNTEENKSQNQQDNRPENNDQNKVEGQQKYIIDNIEQKQLSQEQVIEMDFNNTTITNNTPKINN